MSSKGITPTIKTPVLIYDKNCDICVSWIQKWRHLTHNQCHDTPYQDLPKTSIVNPTACQKTIHFIDKNQDVYTGANAILKSLENSKKYKSLWKTSQTIPGLMRILEWGYQRIANNRQFLSKLLVNQNRKK